MQVEQKQSPYEIHCQRCRVSFPVGTRSCIHCGGRIGRPLPPRAALAAPGSLEEIPEEELPTRRGMLSPMALVWIVLILGGYLYRACAG